VLRYGDPPPGGLTAIVSITNNADKPAVGCVYTPVPVAGTATMIAPDPSWTRTLTVTGSEETRINIYGLATGSNWHVTVTCDNGLLTSVDTTY
jgi:hypothetical protein